MSEEDRLMLDRSPDELGSNDNDDDLGDSDSEDDLMAETTDGERIIYPWMKKIHVAGVGKLKVSLFPPPSPLCCAPMLWPIFRGMLIKLLSCQHPLDPLTGPCNVRSLAKTEMKINKIKAKDTSQPGNRKRKLRLQAH